MPYFYGGIALAIIAGVALVITVRSPREPDGRSQVVAGFNVFWGVITVLFFAPGGLLAAAIISDHSAIGALAVLAVCLSGFGLGVALFIASRRLLAQKKLGRVIGIARWSMVHHVAVPLAFVIASSLDRSSDDFWQLPIIPCSIGLALGWGLHRRARLELSEGGGR